MPDSPTEILIREATRADVPAVVRLLADDGLGRGREAPTDPLPPAYYAAFDELAADPNNRLIVVEADGEIIGTLQLTFIRGLSQQGARRAQVEAVRVDSRYRSAGIGTRLMEWAIARARAEGCRLVQLTTHTSRTDAHRFYERLGFVPSHVGMKLALPS